MKNFCTDTIYSETALPLSPTGKKFLQQHNIIRDYGTADLNCQVEKTIQTVKNLIKAFLEEVQCLRENQNKAVNVLRYSIYSGTKKTPFELHFSRKPGIKQSNL